MGMRDLDRLTQRGRPLLATDAELVGAQVCIGYE
jgi:hypothetical protein